MVIFKAELFVTCVVLYHVDLVISWNMELVWVGKTPRKHNNTLF